MQFDERLGDRQSKPGSFAPARSGSVNLTERGERDADLLFGHADASVMHERTSATVGQLQRLNGNVATRAGELDRIAQQVGEDLAQLNRVAAHQRHITINLVLERDAALLRHQHEGIGAACKHLIEIDFAAVQGVFAALNLRNVQDVVDDGKQMPSSIMDELRILDDFAVLQWTPIVLAEQLREPDDRIE